MTKKIFEELPARKHAPVAAAPASEKGGGAEGSEKKIRQAVYDIRYRARREGIDLRAAFSQYMQNSNLTAQEQAAVREKLFPRGDKKESYNAFMSDGATDVVANAMFKVFVEGQEKEFVYEQESGERKYKIRVTDPKNGRSYVRYADRSKITELRGKGLKVEMTEHGDPYEGKRAKKGGLDPVAKNPAKRDGDVNNDGKKDSTDSYIYNRRDAINAAIAKKKQQQNEEFLVDGTTSTEGQNKGKITGSNVDNYSTGIVKVMPENQADGDKMSKMRRGIYAHTELEGEVIAEKAVSKAQQRFMGMVHAVKKGEMKAPSKEVADAAKGMSGKEAKKYASTKHEGLPEKKEMKEEMDDKKEKCPACGKCPCECKMKRTYRELLKNKLRAMGMKNPIMLGAPDDEEKIMKIMTSSSAKMAAEERVLSQKDGRPGTVEVKKTKEGGFLGIGAKTVSRPVPGTFKQQDVSSKDAARYNRAIDNRFKGHSGSADETPASAIQSKAQRSGHSGYMRVKNPSSIPNTGIPNRPTPARASDQNDAMSWQVGNKFKK